MSNWKDKARERVKEKQSGGSFKPAEGDNVIRILPNPKGEEFPPYLEYRIHREVGPDKRLVRCTKTISGKGECWLCSKIEEMQNSGNRAKIAAASSMAAVEWMLLQIAVLDEKTGKLVGPTRWQIGCSGGKSLGVKLQALLAKEGRSYEHPVKGRNLTLNRVGTGLKTVYGAFEADEEASKVPQSILDRLKPLIELLSKDNEQTQKEAFFGRKRKAEDDEEEETPRKKKPVEDDDEEEETPKKKSKKPADDDEEDEEEEAPKKKATKKKPADDDEDEEDEEDSDDEEEEEEEEEEEKPAKKGKKKPAADEEDEEDEEDSDDEEDEEEEKPAKKKAAAKKKPADDDEEDEEEEEEEEDEEDSDDEEEEEEEEEEEKPAKKKAVAKKPAAKKAPAKKAKK